MTCAAVLERHGDGRALDLRRAFEGACAGDAREIHGRHMAPECTMDYGAAAMEAVFGRRLRPSTEGGRALMVACGSRHMCGTGNGDLLVTLSGPWKRTCDVQSKQ